MTQTGSFWSVVLLALLPGGFMAATSLPAGAAERTNATPFGDKVANSASLRDLHGNRRALHDFKDHAAVVLAFLGAECPIGDLYLPMLLELEKQYRSRKVQFLAVYPNEQEDIDTIAAHAYDHAVPFPVLKDFGQKLADNLGVSRVPTAVVLDSAFVLRYRGRIDDRYGVASRRDKATREDLVQAVEEVLAGKAVSVAETEADGCLLERGGAQPPKAVVTYSKEVARILQNRCQKCHRPDQAAPFAPDLR